MRHLYLYIRPRETAEGDDPPALAALLRHGRVQAAPAGLSEAFCRAQGIARQTDWPIAPLTARATGLDPGASHWLRLDPVFLDVGLRGPYLRAELSLSPAETATLAELLTPLLAEHGFVPYSGPSGVFHVRCPAPPRLRTTPLDEVAGRQPMRFLPRDEDAPLWTRLLHEIQMALHDHPLNPRRLDRGQAPVNSFWPWGVGRLPPPSDGLDAVWGQTPLLAQLARGVGITSLPDPASLAEVLATRGKTGLVMLEAEQVTPAAWEEAWFRPLIRALRLGRLASVTLGGIGRQASVRRLTPWEMWRQWR
ncbi:MAG TPA: hypothetical protein PKH69_11855 [Thiobacillaceae bacterium]|nr:hypothetical protein [Thiobacillaceae bacterium]HNU65164.1 hypothetical protein [Thiobacillaceae bacterium]